MKTVFVIFFLVFTCFSCRKQDRCDNCRQNLVLELDTQIQENYSTVSGLQALLPIGLVEGSAYALTPNPDRCGSQLLLLQANVCNPGNQLLSSEKIERGCTDGTSVYYIVLESSVSIIKVFKKSGNNTVLLAQEPFEIFANTQVFDMIYEAGNLYWILHSSGKSIIQKTDITSGSVETLFVRDPKFYCARFIKYQNKVCILGGYKAGWPQQHIIDLTQSVLWEIQAQDNKEFLLADGSDIYTSTAESQNGIQEVGKYTSGTYEKLYEIKNNEGPGGYSPRLFKSSKGVLFFVQGSILPIVKNISSGKITEGHIFLQKNKELLVLSKQDFSSGEPLVYFTETQDGIWATNLFVETNTSNDSDGNVQFFRWKKCK